MLHLAAMTLVCPLQVEGRGMVIRLLPPRTPCRLGDRPGSQVAAETRHLHIATYSPTSWGSMQDFLRSPLAVGIDVVACQETHLNNDFKVASASSTLSGWGWHSYHGMAGTLPSGFSTGGVAVLVRSSMGSMPSNLNNLLSDFPAEHRGRLIGAAIPTGRFG